MLWSNVIPPMAVSSGRTSGRTALMTSDRPGAVQPIRRPVPASEFTSATQFAISLSCARTYAFDPSCPCSSAPQSANRIERRGRSGSAAIARAASTTIATPVALS